MSLLYDGLNALPYPINPVPFVAYYRSPTQNDYQNFYLGTVWLNRTSQDVYQLVSLSGPAGSPPVSNYAVWALLTTGSGAVTGLTADNAVTAFPAAGVINLFGNGTTISTSAAGNTITFNTTGAVATTYDGNSGSATPSGGVLNIVGTGSITTVASGSTVTISSTAPAENWVEVTGTTQAMVANTGYVANNAGLVTLTLPATAVFGTRLTVTGKGAGGWLIAQNSGQTIFFGTSTTITGTGGSLASTQIRDTIDLVCVTANTAWNVINSVGNITVT